jgi:hypothetical protein
VTPGQFAHLAFFSFLLRRSRADVFGHGSAPLSMAFSFEHSTNEEQSTRNWQIARFSARLAS